MILGIGHDLVDIRRIERSIARHGDRFLERVFTEEERARAERKKRLMLHGPQSAAEAINQADVDALIAGNAASPQAAIDDLFK